MLKLSKISHKLSLISLGLLLSFGVYAQNTDKVKSVEPVEIDLKSILSSTQNKEHSNQVELSDKEAQQIAQDTKLLARENKDNHEKAYIQMSSSVHEVELDGQKLSLSVEYPSMFKESFIVTDKSHILSYAHDESNLQITFKLESLTKNLQDSLSFEDFKADILQRFQDKEHLLYGEYNILKESAKHEPLEYEILVKAFLKKPADGILPDMQNYFYEHNIIKDYYYLTAKCEFFARQAHAQIVEDQFNALSPLCERVVRNVKISLIK